jgi:hypothetical protein
MRRWILRFGRLIVGIEEQIIVYGKGGRPGYETMG